MKKAIILSSALSLLFVITASAQLKVSSSGNVSVGTTANAASTLSVNAIGDTLYAAFINGNCKVDSGYISGDMYNPYFYDDNTLKSLNWAMSQLQNFSVYGFGTFGIPSLNQTPIIYDHFSIDRHNFTNYFPSFVKKDENNHYVINYAELVPLLVYGYQQLVGLITHLHPNGRVQDLLAEETLVTHEDTEEEPQAQPQIAARRFVDAVLYQNTPNPFTAQTEIRFRLPDDTQDAYIYIFDMTGKTLKQLPINSSMQSVTIQGYELSSGMYLYSLVINGQEIDTKRMILSK